MPYDIVPSVLCDGCHSDRLASCFEESSHEKFGNETRMCGVPEFVMILTTFSRFRLHVWRCLVAHGGKGVSKRVLEAFLAYGVPADQHSRSRKCANEATFGGHDSFIEGCQFKLLNGGITDTVVSDQDLTRELVQHRVSLISITYTCILRADVQENWFALLESDPKLKLTDFVILMIVDGT